MSYGPAFLILFVPALIVAVVVRLFGVTRPIVLLASAMAAGTLLGYFITSVTSAMSTSSNQGAVVRTFFIGLLAGLVAAGLVILVSQLLSKK